MQRDGGYAPVTGTDERRRGGRSKMATGRIRRSARRGLAVAVLGWLGVAAVSVPAWLRALRAAPTATVEIRNFAAARASVDEGAGQVTFVNQIPAQNKGGGDLGPPGPSPARCTPTSPVSFFGRNRVPAARPVHRVDVQRRGDQRHDHVHVTGSIPQAGLAAAIAANQVVSTVAGQLPAVPAPVPYVVQTIAPICRPCRASACRSCRRLSVRPCRSRRTAAAPQRSRVRHPHRRPCRPTDRRRPAPAPHRRACRVVQTTPVVGRPEPSPVPSRPPPRSTRRATASRAPASAGPDRSDSAAARNAGGGRRLRRRPVPVFGQLAGLDGPAWTTRARSRGGLVVLAAGSRPAAAAPGRRRRARAVTAALRPHAPASRGEYLLHARRPSSLRGTAARFRVGGPCGQRGRPASARW